MSHHDLKIWPKYYKAVSNGQKTYEVRKNDRDFKEGDSVCLKEWLPDECKFTGCQLDFLVGHVLHLKDFFGNENQFVVFGLVDHPRPPTQ